MVYLLVGANYIEKNKKYLQIKEQYLKESDAQHFDADSFDARRLDHDELKKALISLPVVSPNRVVTVKSAHKLNNAHKDVILAFMKDESKTILILDADQKLGNSTFSKEIKSQATVFEFMTEEKYNVFDVTNAMERQPAVALKILNHIFEDGQHPLQVMGGLVWFWGKHKTRVSKDIYKKGLLYLQEADLNIKRSKIRPDYAVEILVTKLSSLIA